MKIGYDFNKGEIITPSDKPLNEDENKIIYAIMDKLGINSPMYRIEKNSDDYTTLKYKQYDLMRVKFTNNTKWIKILMVDKELKNKYNNDPLFESQKNKNELMWKSIINNIYDYNDILKQVIEKIDTKK